MTPAETAAILRQLTEWRQGADVDPPAPLAVDKAIDAAIEMIDRLEAAEKSDAESIAMYRKARDERDELRAKIEAMEQQEPVAWARKLGLDVPSFGCVTDLKYRPSNIPESSYIPLYALPGAQAQNATSVPTESIGKMLAQAMDAAVANGANSVSMPDELVEVAAWLSGVQPNPANGQNRAVRDVIAERRRQVETEGRTTQHDDANPAGVMSVAAACYAIGASNALVLAVGDTSTCPAPEVFPWEDAWWKPTTPRRDLVKAAALILAEIERLDRAAAPKPEGE